MRRKLKSALSVVLAMAMGLSSISVPALAEESDLQAETTIELETTADTEATEQEEEPVVEDTTDEAEEAVPDDTADSEEEAVPDEKAEDADAVEEEADADVAEETGSKSKSSGKSMNADIVLSDLSSSEDVKSVNIQAYADDEEDTYGYIFFWKYDGTFPDDASAWAGYFNTPYYGITAEEIDEDFSEIYLPVTLADGSAGGASTEMIHDHDDDYACIAFEMPAGSSMDTTLSLSLEDENDDDLHVMLEATYVDTYKDDLITTDYLPLDWEGDETVEADEDAEIPFDEDDEFELEDEEPESEVESEDEESESEAESEDEKPEFETESEDEEFESETESEDESEDDNAHVSETGLVKLNLGVGGYLDVGYNEDSAETYYYDENNGDELEFNAGEDVYFAVTAYPFYYIDSVFITDVDGNVLESFVEDYNDECYYFTLQADPDMELVVNATFIEDTEEIEYMGATLAETTIEYQIGENGYLSVEQDDSGVTYTSESMGESGTIEVSYPSDVTLSMTAMADEGYVLDEISAIDENGEELLTYSGEEAYNKGMDFDVETTTDSISLSVSFKEGEDPIETPEELTFDDLEDGTIAFATEGYGYYGLYTKYSETSMLSSDYIVDKDEDNNLIVDLDALKEDGIDELYIYALGSGQGVYSGAYSTGNAVIEELDYDDNIGGYAWLRVDLTDVDEPEAIVVRFPEEQYGIATLKAADFTKSLDVRRYYRASSMPGPTSCGKRQDMYNDRPLTGELSRHTYYTYNWGGSYWSVKRSTFGSVADIYSNFGVSTNGVDDEEWTKVGLVSSSGTDVMLRCTGCISSYSEYSGLGDMYDLYMACCDIDEDDDWYTYTFVIWGNGGNGSTQTKEGYVQFRYPSSSEGTAKVRFRKYLHTEAYPVWDVDEAPEAGNSTFDIATANAKLGQDVIGIDLPDLTGNNDSDDDNVEDLDDDADLRKAVRFKLYRLTDAGKEYIENMTKSQCAKATVGGKNAIKNADMSDHTTYDDYFEYVYQLMVDVYWATGSASGYFKKVFDDYADDGNGRTGYYGWTVDDQDCNDVYVVLETKTPVAMTYGWQIDKEVGIPEGMGEIGAILMAEGDIEKTDTLSIYYKRWYDYDGLKEWQEGTGSGNGTVKLYDNPVVDKIRIKKVIEDGYAPADVGLTWPDFSWQLSTTDDFDKDYTIEIPFSTGDPTSSSITMTIYGLAPGRVYYIRESPNCKAVKDGYVEQNDLTISFYVEGDSKAWYSDTTWTYDDVTAMYHPIIGLSYELDVNQIGNKLQFGYLKLIKKSDNTSITNNNSAYSLANAQYTVYEDSGCNTPATDMLTGETAVFTTDADGNSNTVALKFGDYYVKEAKQPAGYKADTTVYQANVSASNLTEDKASVVNVGIGYVTDVPLVYYFDILLDKSTPYNTNKSLAGAVFKAEFYAGATSAGSSATKTWYFVTKEDSDGNYVIELSDDYIASGYTSDDLYYDSDGKPCLPLGTLVMTEEKAPTGYVASTDKLTYVLESDTYSVTNGSTTKSGSASDLSNRKIPRETVLQVKIDDIPPFGGVVAYKIDDETADGSPQGDATLSGATFGIYSKNSYTVVRKSDQDKAYNNGDLVMSITTDSSGKAESGVELQGDSSYQLKEITPPTGYTASGSRLSFDFTLPDEDGYIYDPGDEKIINTVIKGGVQIQKIDYMLDRADDHGDTDLSNAQFAVVNASTNAVLDPSKNLIETSGLSGTSITYSQVADKLDSTVVTLTTDKNGFATTSKDVLPYGTYYVIETKAPKGYELNQTWVGYFQVREDGKIYDVTTISGDTSKNTAPDQIYLGGVKVQKYDTEKDRADGHGDAHLGGAEFTIINASDTIAKNTAGNEIASCGLNDTNVTYAKLKELSDADSNASKNVMQRITTDDTGWASTGQNDLPYGTYYIIETKAPSGYFLNESWVGKVVIRTDHQIYSMDNSDYPVTTVKSDDSHLQVHDQVYRSDIQLQKDDFEMEDTFEQGTSKFVGAKFAIINASDYSSLNYNGKEIPSAQSKLSSNPSYADLRALADDGSYTMQVIETDANGVAKTTGKALPYGTYYVIEVESSYGYWIDDSFIGKVVIRDDALTLKLGDTGKGSSGNSSFEDRDETNSKLASTVDQQERRNDLCFEKVDIDGNHFPYLPFMISAYDDDDNLIEQHVVVADVNGWVSTASKSYNSNTHSYDDCRPHTNHTNEFDKYVVDDKVTAEGQAILDNMTASLTDPNIILTDETDASTWGIWFQGNSNDYDGTAVDSYGALYTAYYQITEIQCTANASREENMLWSEVLKIENTTGTYVELMTDNADMHQYDPFVNTEIYLESTAKDLNSDTKTIAESGTVEVKDTVEYDHVSSDKTYRMQTKFIDVTAGNECVPIVGTNDPDSYVTTDDFGDTWVAKVFQPEKKHSTTTTDGSIDMTAILDTTGRCGHIIVAVDCLYEDVMYADGSNVWLRVASHEDYDDTDQYLYVPDLHTSAIDELTGNHEGSLTTKDYIIDTVDYSYLSRGMKYLITMEVVDAETGKTLNGETVYTEISKSGQSGLYDGTVEMPEYAIDSSKLEGKTVVVIERLYLEGEDGGSDELLVEHDSLLDEDQTVHYTSVETTASDGETGDHVGTVEEVATVYDEVDLTNLVFSDHTDNSNSTYTYTVTGGLVYQTDWTGVDGVEHKAGDSVPTLSGTYDSVTITCDTNGNATFTYPDGTKAKGSISNIRYGYNRGKTVDPTDEGNNEYVQDKKTMYADITVELIYKVDSTLLEGTTVVVFEDVYDNDVLIASHHDIDDDKQSVHYPKLETSAQDVATESNVGYITEDGTIVDTVILTNLVPGMSYTVKGRLKDQSTGEDLVIDGQTFEASADIFVTNDGEITAPNGEAVTTTNYNKELCQVDGTVDLTFHLDASGLEAMTAVAFEKLFHNDVEVTNHEDITDHDESVYFPKIRSNAWDSETGDHVGTVEGDDVVYDTVYLWNLRIGEEYTVYGVLYDKDTELPILDPDGNLMTESCTFIAGETSPISVAEHGSADGHAEDITDDNLEIRITELNEEYGYVNVARQIVVGENCTL